VATQVLNKEYSIDDRCVCRHLHGHQGSIKIVLTAPEINLQGMVVDFKMINWFKKWLDETLDHKFIMDYNDPLFNHEIPDVVIKRVQIKWFDDGYGILQEQLRPGVENIESAVMEKYDGMIIVNFVPTSENLSKWLFHIVSKKMKKIGVTVSNLEFCETPKTSATYFNQ